MDELSTREDVLPADRRPLSLIIVAVLFLFFGVCSAIQVVVLLAQRHLDINLGVLGIFIGAGLLRLSPGWRTCGLVFLWIAMIGIPVVCGFFLTVKEPLVVNVFGRTVGHAPKELGIAIGAAAFLCTLWEYRVLTRPDVRRLFGLAGT